MEVGGSGGCLPWSLAGGGLSLDGREKPSPTKEGIAEDGYVAGHPEIASYLLKVAAEVVAAVEQTYPAGTRVQGEILERRGD